MNPSEETKVALSQQRIENVEKDVSRILENHLPHMNDAISNLSNKIDSVSQDLTGQINKLNVKMAWYVGISVGAVGVINILVTLYHGK